MSESNGSSTSSNDSIQKAAERLVANIGRELIGKRTQILHALTCLVAGGHLLLEDVPGLGKTTLAKALARSCELTFRRLQCTPDLMPGDITGVSVYNPQKQEFEFHPGPVFAQVLLADELNRASPRTQSALLEAMGEGTVTVDRQTWTLQPPFFVIATQNPIEFAGTYPLPEAQMDRFMMRLSLGYPDRASELAMLESLRDAQHPPLARTLLNARQLLQLRKRAGQVTVAPAVLEYIVRLVDATRTHDELHLGASPRASLALLRAAQALSLLEGAQHVRPATVQALARPVLEHRLLFRNRQMTADECAQFFVRLLHGVPLPDNPRG